MRLVTKKLEGVRRALDDLKARWGRAPSEERATLKNEGVKAISRWKIAEEMYNKVKENCDKARKRW